MTKETKVTKTVRIETTTRVEISEEFLRDILRKHFGMPCGELDFDDEWFRPFDLVEKKIEHKDDPQ